MIYKCPICKTATDSEKGKEFPFCSERCRMRDLGNWSSEKYVVSDPIFDEEELERTEDNRKTIILDLNEEQSGTDDTER